MQLFNSSLLVTLVGLTLSMSPLGAQALIGAGELAPGDLVVTEVMPNPTLVSDADGEWFEILNAASDDVNLNGLVIADDDIDSHTIVSDVIVPQGGYALLARDGDTGMNGGLPTADYVYSGFILANTGDEVVILDGVLEISRMSYTSAMETPGRSLSLRCITDDPSDQANWFRSDGNQYNAQDFGTPRERNDVVPDGDGNGVGDICEIEPGDLVIHEVMPNPTQVFDSAGEWFEIHNATDRDIDLFGLTLADDDFDVHTIDSNVIAPAGGYTLLARNGDAGMNGGLPPVDYVYSAYFLGNSGDEVVIVTPEGVEISRMSYSADMVEAGASLALVCPDADPSDPDNWVLDETNLYNAQDTGTPRAPNGLDSDGDGIQDECDSCPFDPENDADGDGVCGDVDFCPDTAIPEATVPAQGLGVNRYALMDDDDIFDTTHPKHGKHPESLDVGVEDTGGCSCEQIIDELGLGRGHVEFGCSRSAMEEWID